MKKRFLLTGIIVAVVHLVVAFGSLMICFGIDTFDNPDYQPTAIQRIAERTSRVLIQPGLSLWTPWMSEYMPGVVEWMFFIGNSFLWGFAIALFINAPTLLIKKNRPASIHLL